MTTANVPVYAIGDVIRNVLTGEEGQIVRTLNSSEVLRKVETEQPAEPAYIVSLPPGPFARAREALWLRSEVVVDGETSAEVGERAAAKDSPESCWVCGKDVFPEDHEVDILGRPVHCACHRSDSIPIGV